MLSKPEDMIAWGLLILPLIVIAWSAVWFASVEAERNRYERYKRFHAIMEQLAKSDGATADKMAAAYELRNYREYKDIISKIFVDGRVRQDSGDALQKQLKDTLDHIGH
ncbi:hypothetical protein ABI_42500 [Asticcacaulis biprosthecium C19]|uniref:Uncharacterized protein n=1 Tax=Asticcacaulis biprosthecium C19 TaxID=715226 RepID=F4QSV7_9CAUL|nr:hypothetical protein [Asticcacaulis biprosthecium]EGF89827.1 hypothetical protein ABI_42500 [Asticcacaulis biprosthecium C19]